MYEYLEGVDLGRFLKNISANVYMTSFCADFFHHQRTQGIAQYGLQNTHKLVKFIHLLVPSYLQYNRHTSEIMRRTSRKFTKL